MFGAMYVLMKSLFIKLILFTVDIENIHGASGGDVITSPVGSEGFVSIDGKRTYLNLFGESTEAAIIEPTKPHPGISPTNAITGTGYAVVEPEKPKPQGAIKQTQGRPPIYKRPSQPVVR